MDISIQDVTEIRVTKTRKHASESGDFSVRTIIITDTDGRTVSLDLFSNTDSALKVVNKDRWAD
tara:strand:- start:428 stop:619 length:192 start_codon:yes stop_codon:yes gene_type:complete